MAGKRFIVTPPAGAGWTVYRNLDLDETGQVIKASAAVLGGWVITNVGAATRYVKLYNKATAPDENDTPMMTIPVAASAISPHEMIVGIAGFTAGLSARATTGVADNDTGAPGANEVVVHVLYN